MLNPLHGNDRFGDLILAETPAEWLRAARANEARREAQATVVTPPRAMPVSQTIAVLDADAPARTRRTVPAMPYGVTGGKVEPV